MKVFVLMGGHDPVEVYMDKSLAMYDCWLMAEGERYDENPTDYWVKGLELIEEKFTDAAPAET